MRGCVRPGRIPGPEALCRDANADDALLRTIRCPAMPADRAALRGGEPSWPVTTPLWRHRAHTVPDLGMLREWFGLAAGEMEEKCAPLLRFLQAETLRYCAERLRMREKNAAGLFVADPFDAIASLYSCALFDGDAPRPAYYALKDALRPLHVCARLDRMAYYCGTTLEARVDLICALRTQPGRCALRRRFTTRRAMSLQAIRLRRSPVRAAPVFSARSCRMRRGCSCCGCAWKALEL